MISIFDIFKLVLRYAYEKKGRVILTISGIIIGIFTFTFFIFLSQGLSNAITQQFTSFGVNVIGIQPATNSQNAGPPGGGGLTDNDLEKVKQVVRDYKYISPAIFYTGQYEYSREKRQITSLAYPPDIWDEVYQDLGLEIEEGRFLRQNDKGSAVIGAKLIDEFGDNNQLTLGSSIKVDGKSLRIVGILKERGDLFVDSALLTTFDDIKEISGDDTYTVIRVSFLEGVDLDEMIEKVDRKLNPNGKEKRVEITTPSQVLEQFDQILGLLTMIISFVSSIALLVGGINVMNTMHSNVVERINEISVFKAIGATNTDVRNLFLVESSILGFIGAIIGFALSFALAKVISYLITNFAGYNVPVYFDIVFFIEVLFFTTIFAVIFGTYPAIKGAKVNPADNLRDE